MSSVIDVHTHMMGEEWFALLKEHGGPHYTIQDIGNLKGDCFQSRPRQM